MKVSFNLGIFVYRKLFCCCFSYLWPFLPNMNDIKVESAIHRVSDFDFFFSINLSAVHLAENTGPFLGINLWSRNKFNLAVIHVLCCAKEIKEKGELVTSDNAEDWGSLPQFSLAVSLPTSLSSSVTTWGLGDGSPSHCKQRAGFRPPDDPE